MCLYILDIFQIRDDVKEPEMEMNISSASDWRY